MGGSLTLGKQISGREIIILSYKIVWFSDILDSDDYFFFSKWLHLSKETQKTRKVIIWHTRARARARGERGKQTVKNKSLMLSRKTSVWQ